MARKPIQIDRDKLRAEVRKLGNEYVFFMLDEAEPALEKAVQLAPPGDELPLNNLARMRRLRQQSGHKPTRNKVQMNSPFPTPFAPAGDE